MITINNVRDGVIATLNRQFPNIKIYGEEIKQGFKVPCFFVKLLLGNQVGEFNKRYLRYHSFDIHFFPQSGNEECHNIAEELYRKIEYLEVNSGLLRGTKLRHEVVDGVLHFFVDYDFHVMREREKGTKMNTLTQEGSIRE